MLIVRWGEAAGWVDDEASLVVLDAPDWHRPPLSCTTPASSYCGSLLRRKEESLRRRENRSQGEGRRRGVREKEGEEESWRRKEKRSQGEEESGKRREKEGEGGRRGVKEKEGEEESWMVNKREKRSQGEGGRRGVVDGK
ncbi:hypothetical protein Pcinc_040497 [Petrolisthes cinctipes]|uniref:Uncharacterized protein n=1 Tax=Petrolisthes cinctipes TaxID=88211 RepID=A0AAE1BM49_PETCI|nr:hypothetical protein Pcinc_040497 [Petrolisthes cinctipes]